MYFIDIQDQKIRHDIDELIRVFLKPSDFVFVENGQDPDKNGIMIGYPEGIKNKDSLKRYFYDQLSESTGYKPPWGILTGVRPTKKCNDYFNAGLDGKAVEALLKDEFYLREDKIRLLLETCLNQKPINESALKKSVSIYIGIPFCPTRCTYCSFASNKSDPQKISLYLTALFKEMDYVSEELKKNGLYPESIYLGGGTPTALSADDFSIVLQKISSLFDFTHVKEFTVEAGRPDTITYKKLEAIVKNKGNRISINPQTMHQKTLDAIGRDHSPEQIREAFNMARTAGIPMINADIIAGLPGEGDLDFRYTLDQVLKLEPQNITVHTLAMKRASKLKELRKEYNYEGHESLDNMITCSREILKASGFSPYYLYRQKQMAGNFENVGYATQGTQGIYNIRIMEENQTIIALGAGGISKVYFPQENRHERVPNVSDLAAYIDRIDEMIKRKGDKIFNI